jgi:serine/threonine-protein kinase RIO1
MPLIQETDAQIVERRMLELEGKLKNAEDGMHMYLRYYETERVEREKVQVQLRDERFKNTKNKNIIRELRTWAEELKTEVEVLQRDGGKAISAHVKPNVSASLTELKMLARLT